MKQDSLQELLEQADAFAPLLASGAAAELAGAVRRRAARRARLRRVGAMAVVAGVCGVLLVQALRPERKTLGPVAMKSLDVARVRAELAELEGEASLHLKVARAVEKAESEMTRWRAGERSMADDPTRRLEIEREVAAAILVHEADRAVGLPGRALQAEEAYRRIVRLFPDTSAADEARRRLGDGV